MSPGRGPIFLYDVQCSSGDLPSLMDCSTGSVPGIHNCQHSQDIGVKCQGQLTCVILVRCLVKICKAEWECTPLFLTSS